MQTLDCDGAGIIYLYWATEPSYWEYNRIVSDGKLFRRQRMSQVVAALAGGAVELGDRVACLRAGGAPPFGTRGTVRPGACPRACCGLACSPRCVVGQISRARTCVLEAVTFSMRGMERPCACRRAGQGRAVTFRYGIEADWVWPWKLPD